MMMNTILDMTFGMLLGMGASPIMMKGIKVMRQRQKVNKILRQIAQEKRKQVNENHEEINQIEF